MSDEPGVSFATATVSVTSWVFVGVKATTVKVTPGDGPVMKRTMGEVGGMPVLSGGGTVCLTLGGSVWAGYGRLKWVVNELAGSAAGQPWVDVGAEEQEGAPL